jgi:23S rRNA pseudouridine1911/1915/1917 synthase
MELSRRFEVAPEDAGARLDVFLAGRLPEHSRAKIAKAIRQGLARVNGKTVSASRKLSRGDIVECEPIPETPPPDDIVPESIPIEVVYEDEYLMVVNKPVGMTTHPAAGSRSGTLVHALLGRGATLSSGSAGFRPGIVHRLDKDTSGLMLVAKQDAAHARLARMIADREVTRLYECIVVGAPKQDEFHVEGAIGRHPKDRKRMAVLPDGAPGARDARTDVAVIERLPGHALLHVKLRTGRTHQIRVHLSSIGLPIVGDPIYGGRRSAAPLFALRAFHLRLAHPVTERELSFTLPRPPEWETFLEALRVGRAPQAN